MSLDMVDIVVKAPNQKIADLTVKCSLDWTVKMLKDHLSEIYPSKPKPEEQKLIYFGQLLHNSSVLKDVLLLKQTDVQFKHTMHLVCLRVWSQLKEQKNKRTLNNSASVAASAPAENVSNVTSAGTSAASVANLQNSVPNFMANNANISEAEYYNNYLQQYYSQQQQYVAQYWRNFVNPVGVTYAIPQYCIVQSGLYYPQQYVPQPNIAQPQQGPAAADAPVFDNEEAMQRHAQNHDNQGNPGNVRNANVDWLEFAYTAVRILFLFSLVYVYTSFWRLLSAVAIGVIIWMYRHGYFEVAARFYAQLNVPNNNENDDANNNAVGQDAPNNQEQDDPPEAPPTDQPQPAEQTEGANHSTADAPDIANAGAAEEIIPIENNFITLLLSFLEIVVNVIVGFVLSLFPNVRPA